MVQMPNVLEVHPSVPATNVKEFIAYLKANEGKVSYASAGNGSSAHLATELPKATTGRRRNTSRIAPRDRHQSHVVGAGARHTTRSPRR